MEIEIRLLESETVSETVTDAPNDKEPLEPTLAATRPVIENIAAVLIDSGFYSAAAVTSVERGREGQPGPVVYAARARTRGGCCRGDGAPALDQSRTRTLRAAQTNHRARVRHPSKECWGFRRFSLRGLGHVRTEWTLVTLAYNLKRLSHLGTRLQAA